MLTHWGKRLSPLESVCKCTTMRESFFSVHEFLPQRTRRPQREAIPSLRSLRSLRLWSLIAASAALCPSVVSILPSAVIAGSRFRHGLDPSGAREVDPKDCTNESQRDSATK